MGSHRQVVSSTLHSSRQASRESLAKFGHGWLCWLLKWPWWPWMQLVQLLFRLVKLLSEEVFEEDGQLIE